MKIEIIRHEKVDMSWDKKYNATAYDLACNTYDKSPIILERKSSIKVDSAKPIYISELSRAYETACKIFDKTTFYKTALLNEVPLISFKDTNKTYPLWLWNIAGRMQWFWGNKRQPESKNETILRAKKMIKLLEKQGEDCYIITHGFYMRIFIIQLKKQGYKIRKPRLFGISNLGRIIAEKTLLPINMIT